MWQKVLQSGNVESGNIEVLNMFTAQSGNTTQASLFTHNFQANYKKVIVIIDMNDTNNNGDNYCKVFDSQKSNTTFTTWKDDVSDSWDKCKLGDYVSSGCALASVDSSYTNDKDKNATIYYAHGVSGASCFFEVSYKDNVKQGDSAYIYVNTYRRCLVTILGIS